MDIYITQKKTNKTFGTMITLNKIRPITRKRDYLVQRVKLMRKSKILLNYAFHQK